MIKVLHDVAGLGKKSKYYYELAEPDVYSNPQICADTKKLLAGITVGICAGLLALDYWVFKHSSRKKKLLEDRFDDALRIIQHLEMLPIQE